MYCFSYQPLLHFLLHTSISYWQTVPHTQRPIPHLAVGILCKSRQGAGSAAQVGANLFPICHCQVRTKNFQNVQLILCNFFQYLKSFCLASTFTELIEAKSLTLFFFANSGFLSRQAFAVNPNNATFKISASSAYASHSKFSL